MSRQVRDVVGDDRTRSRTPPARPGPCASSARRSSPGRPPGPAPRARPGARPGLHRLEIGLVGQARRAGWPRAACAAPRPASSSPASVVWLRDDPAHAVDLDQLRVRPRPDEDAPELRRAGSISRAGRAWIQAPSVSHSSPRITSAVDQPSVPGAGGVRTPGTKRIGSSAISGSASDDRAPGQLVAGPPGPARGGRSPARPRTRASRPRRSSRAWRGSTVPRSRRSPSSARPPRWRRGPPRRGRPCAGAASNRPPRVDRPRPRRVRRPGGGPSRRSAPPVDEPGPRVRGPAVEGDRPGPRPASDRLDADLAHRSRFFACFRLPASDLERVEPRVIRPVRSCREGIHEDPSPTRIHRSALSTQVKPSHSWRLPAFRRSGRTSSGSRRASRSSGSIPRSGSRGSTGRGKR